MNRLYATSKSKYHTRFTTSPLTRSGIKKGKRELMFWFGTKKPAGWRLLPKDDSRKQDYSAEIDCTGEDPNEEIDEM